MAMRNKDMPRSTPMWLRVSILVLLSAILISAFIAAALALIHIWAQTHM